MSLKLKISNLSKLALFSLPEIDTKNEGDNSLINRFLTGTSNPLRGLLNATLYVGASLEAGNAWQNSSDVSFKNSLLAGSVFVGADTFIGPVYLAGGLAEGGHSALYLFVGRPY